MERFPEEETTEENLDDEREEFRSLAKNIAGERSWSIIKQGVSRETTAWAEGII